METARRAGTFLLGLIMFIAGLILIPLPIPGGVLVVLAGVAIWARDFGWAQRLLGWLRGQALTYWRALPRWVRLSVSVSLMCGGLAATWWSFHQASGFVV